MTGKIAIYNSSYRNITIRNDTLTVRGKNKNKKLDDSTRSRFDLVVFDDVGKTKDNKFFMT